MDAKFIKRQFEEKCMIKYGINYKADVFKKAYAKAQRWAAAAYGEPDMEEFMNENGTEGILPYYEETLNEPTGRDTFNRHKGH